MFINKPIQVGGAPIVGFIGNEQPGSLNRSITGNTIFEGSVEPMPSANATMDQRSLGISHENCRTKIGTWMRKENCRKKGCGNEEQLVTCC